METPLRIIKSPFNYIGGKYKLLPTLFELFPENVDTFVDLFAGGGDVFINAQANKVVANDINKYIIDIYRTFQNHTPKDIIRQIDDIISSWNLSKTNEESYLSFRSHYNGNPSPLELYVLVCHSFNYQFRFNSKHEFNNPFGRNRSWFNPALRQRLADFVFLLKNIELHSSNFKDFNLDFMQHDDFLYADPPYLITTGSYNDGKRGFEGWSMIEERALLDKLDELDRRNIRFALSNVLEHKGMTNYLLNDWRINYNTHFLDKHYNNSNYQTKNTEYRTVEVLITNY